MESAGSMPYSQRLSNNPYPKPNQHNSLHWYLFFFKSNLILSSHLRLGFPKCLFPVGVPVKILKALLPSSILATWPFHLNLLEKIALTILGEQYKLWSSPLWSRLNSLFSTLLDPNSRIRILFSNTRRSSLNLRVHISQPCSTTGNIIVLYTLIL